MQYNDPKTDVVFKKSTARSMKADGMPMDVIAKYTGLTPDEITLL